MSLIGKKNLPSGELQELAKAGSLKSGFNIRGKIIMMKKIN